jgi:hypothetical protein
MTRCGKEAVEVGTLPSRLRWKRLQERLRRRLLEMGEETLTARSGVGNADAM